MPPPHWPVVKEVVEPYQTQFDACEALIAFSFENFPSERFVIIDPPPPHADVLISRTYLRSTKTYQAALRLAFVGYGVQAAMLGRTLFEDMVLAHWISRNPEEASSTFLRHRLFQIAEYSRLERQHGLVHPAEAEWEALSAEERTAILKEFKGTRTWWKKSLRAMVKEIEDQWAEEERPALWRVFDLVHHRTNNVLHHSSVGLSPTIEEMPSGEKVIDLGPSTLYFYVALPMMFCSYAWLLTLVYEGEVRDRCVEVINAHDQAWGGTIGNDLAPDATEGL